MNFELLITGIYTIAEDVDISASSARSVFVRLTDAPHDISEIDIGTFYTTHEHDILAAHQCVKDGLVLQTLVGTWINGDDDLFHNSYGVITVDRKLLYFDTDDNKHYLNTHNVWVMTPTDCPTGISIYDYFDNHPEVIAKKEEYGLKNIKRTWIQRLSVTQTLSYMGDII